MRTLRQKILRAVVVWMSSLAFLFAAYYPVTVVSYAHHDQYRYFVEDFHNNAAVKSTHSRELQWGLLRMIGRPLAAEIEFLIFRFVNSPEDLIPVRMIGLGLAAVAMTMVVMYLLAWQLSAPVAFCLGGALFTLPTYQFTIFMASLNHPVAHILALGCALLLRTAWANPTTWDWRPLLRSIGCHFIAGAMMVAALLSYQPSAFVVFIPMAIDLVFGGLQNWPAARKQLVHDVWLVGLCCVIYYFHAKSYYDHHGGIGAKAYQIALNANFLDRLDRLIVDVGGRALNFWNLYPRSGVSIAVVVFMATGAMIACYRWFRRAEQRAARAKSPWIVIQYLAAIAFVMLVSEATYLAAPTELSLYRMHFALGAMTLLIAFGSVMSWVRCLPENWSRRTILVGAMLLAIGGGAASHYLTRVNCLNSYTELAYIRSQIAAQATHPIRRIHVVKPSITTRSYLGWTLVPGDEFFVPSAGYDCDNIWQVRAALLGVFTSASFVVQPLPNNWLGARVASGLSAETIAVSTSRTDEPIVPSNDMIVIDMNQLLGGASCEDATKAESIAGRFVRCL